MWYPGGSIRRARLSVLLLVAVLGAIWPATGGAQTLYRTPDRILRLTASSGKLAWAQERAGTICFHLYRRSAFGTVPHRLTKCRLDPRGSNGRLEWVRIVGPRVFWDETGNGNTEADHSVFSTSRLGMLKGPTVYTINCGGTGGAGKTLGPLAPGAPYFSVFTVTTEGQCGLVSGTGVVRRLVVAPGGGISRPLVPGAPGPAFLADAAHRLLEVPGVISNFQIGPTHTLELRGDRSGKLRWSASVHGHGHGDCAFGTVRGHPRPASIGHAADPGLRDGLGHARACTGGAADGPAHGLHRRPARDLCLPALDHDLERAPQPAAAAAQNATRGPQPGGGRPAGRLEHAPHDPWRGASACDAVAVLA